MIGGNNMYDVDKEFINLTKNIVIILVIIIASILLFFLVTSIINLINKKIFKKKYGIN